MSISMAPVPAASARAEPLMPAKKTLTSTFTWPRPPRMWPTRALAKSTSRSVSLPLVMRSAARMKNGIAIMGKESMPLKARCGKTSMGIPS